MNPPVVISAAVWEVMSVDINRMAGLLKKLAINNPWSWSTEGLDDCCMFCDSERRVYRDGRYIYEHEQNCSWLEAREFLGLTQPEHARQVVA